MQYYKLISAFAICGVKSDLCFLKVFLLISQSNTTKFSSTTAVCELILKIYFYCIVAYKNSLKWVVLAATLAAQFYITIRW